MHHQARQPFVIPRNPIHHPPQVNHEPQLVEHHEPQLLSGKTSNGDLIWKDDVACSSGCSEIICLDYKESYFHTATLIDDIIILIGGRVDSRTILNQAMIFDMKAMKWQCIEYDLANPFYRNAHSACVNKHSRIVIHGGYRAGALHDTIIIEVKRNTSQPSEIELEYQLLDIILVEGQTPSRYSHTAEIYNDKMYVFGGLNERHQPTNTLWMLDFDQSRWYQVATTGTPPNERSLHSSVLYENKMFIFGGASSQKGLTFNDLCFLDLSTSPPIWNRSNPIDLRPGSLDSSWMWEKSGDIILFGGHNGITRSSVCYQYSIAKNTWKLLKFCEKDSKPRSGHDVVYYDDKLIVFGGFANNNQCISEIRCFSIPEEIEKKKDKNGWENIGNSFLNRTYSDVSFKVKDQEFPCHKVILASRCKYFANMFESNMSETHTPVIEIPDVDPTIFRALLEFVYYEKIDLTQELAMELIELANKYCFEELINACVGLLASKMTKENILEIANRADVLDCQKLINAVVEFVQKNLRYFKENGILERFPKSILASIISELMQK